MALSIVELSWYVDIVNLLVSGVYSPKRRQQKRKLYHNSRSYSGTSHICLSSMSIQMFEGVFQNVKPDKFFESFHSSPYGGHHGGERATYKVLLLGFIWTTLFKDALSFVKGYNQCKKMRTISRHHKIPLNNILELQIFDVQGIGFMGLFPPSYGNLYILIVVDYLPKCVTTRGYPLVITRWLRSKVTPS